MKKITVVVRDSVAAQVLTYVASDVTELTMEHIGDDPAPTPPALQLVSTETIDTQPAARALDPAPKKQSRRPRKSGDKTAADIILDMFDEHNTVRDSSAIADMLSRLGFSKNTAATTIGRLVNAGLVVREPNRAVRYIGEFESHAE